MLEDEVRFVFTVALENKLAKKGAAVKSAHLKD